MDETGSKDLSEEEKKQQIRRNIGTTLEDMGATLGEIKTRLAPDELKRRAKEHFKSATKNKARNIKNRLEDTMTEYRGTMKDTVRDNPLAAAAAGAGIGWLLFSMINERRNRSRGLHYPHECYTFYGTSTGRFEEMGPEERQSRITQLKNKGTEVAEDFKERVRDQSDTLRDQMSEKAARLRGAASEWGREAGWQADRVKKGFQRRLRTNPMPIGIAAAAAGAMLGWLVPESTWEDRAMGEKRDELLGLAKEKGQEKLDLAKEAALRSKETFKEEMKQEQPQRNEEAGA